MAKHILNNNQGEKFTLEHKDNAGLMNVSTTDLMSKTTPVADRATLKATVGSVDGQAVYQSDIALMYIWDSTSIETDNGGTIIQVDGVTTGRWIASYSGAVNVKWFGASASYIPPSIYDIGSELLIDDVYTGDISTNCSLVFSKNAFINGTVSITNIQEYNCDSIRASSICIKNDVISFSANSIYADGTIYTGSNGKPGIYSDSSVDSIYIKNLIVKNCGGTVKYTSATGFKGNESSLLRIDNMLSLNNAYDGFQYANYSTNSYAFDKVILGTLMIDGCGNTTNPAAQNQHHGCYLSSANTLIFDTIIVKNHQNGYGIKFGSSAISTTKSVNGGTLHIDGITNGRGGITVVDRIDNFIIDKCIIKNVNTQHIQIYGGHTGVNGSFIINNLISSEERASISENCVTVNGSLESLIINNGTVNGWLDGTTRRGYLIVVDLEENIVVDYLKIKLSTSNIAGTILRVKGSDGTDGNIGAIVKMLDFSNNYSESTGNFILIEHNAVSSATVQRGIVSNNIAYVNNLSSAWTFPAHSFVEVENNLLYYGATLKRMNDMHYSRMSNITQFDEVYWVDTATGTSVIPATYDMQFPDTSLGDGYVGKIYYNGNWKDYGSIVV